MTTYPHGALNSAVAEVLRGLRGRKSMTQAELAEIVGVDQSQLSKLLRGAKEWRVPQVEAAATALGSDVVTVFADAAQLATQGNYTLAADRGEDEPHDDEPGEGA